MDRIAGGLFDFVAGTMFPAANPTTGDRFALAAQGGYGRGSLAPYSDLDLLFLLPWKVTPRVEQIVEYVLLLLWDTGLKVGHATRSVEECLRLASRDTTICTSLLETRFLWGEIGVYEEFRLRFAAELVRKTGPEFAERKLAEPRRAPICACGDSRYVVEPNVKEGKGGLRDLHTLYWIAKYLYRVDEVSELEARGRVRPRRACGLSQVGAVPVDRPLPPALSRRAGRGAADLRPAAGDRGPAGLPQPRRRPPGRAIHEALLSGGEEGGRPDPHLLRRRWRTSTAAGRCFPSRVF